MDATWLQLLWFILIAVLIIAYFILDGFDLGIGVLYPILGRDDRDKAIMRRAVGPVWDGNEVWLLTAGGALFAAFPPAYATSFSGFYLAIMLVLFGLIIRGVAVEFCGRDPKWRGFWNICFFIGSLLPALLYGVAIGNLLQGLPLNEHGDYMGSFFALVTPFTLVCGLLGLLQMVCQGACWLAVKTDDQSDLHVRAHKTASISQILVIVLFALATLVVFTIVHPTMEGGIPSVLRIVFVVLFVAAIVVERVFMHTGKDLHVFISSSVICISLVGLVFSTLCPRIIPAVNDAFSITIAGAAASDLALTCMTVIACIGIPLVLIYHVIVYRTFRGKIKSDELDY